MSFLREMYSGNVLISRFLSKCMKSYHLNQSGFAHFCRKSKICEQERSRQDVSKVMNCMWCDHLTGGRENTPLSRIHSKPNLTWPPRQQKHQKGFAIRIEFFTLQLSSQRKIFKKCCFNIVIFWVHPPTIFYSGRTIYSNSYVWRRSLPKFHFLLLQTWAVGSQVNMEFLGCSPNNSWSLKAGDGWTQNWS